MWHSMSHHNRETVVVDQGAGWEFKNRFFLQLISCDLGRGMGMFIAIGKESGLPSKDKNKPGRIDHERIA